MPDSNLNTHSKEDELRTETFSLEQHPFYWFTYIVLHRGRELNQSLAPYDVDYPRWRVMAVLKEWPGCTMQFLSDAAGVDRTTLTHTVRLMTDAGLVLKTQRKSDRRSVVLSLTPAGEAKLDQVLPFVIATNEKCLAGLSETEVDNFLGTLRHIILNIRAPQEAADKNEPGQDDRPEPTPDP